MRIKVSCELGDVSMLWPHVAKPSFTIMELESHTTVILFFWLYELVKFN